MSKFKKIFALALAFALVLGLMPHISTKAQATTYTNVKIANMVKDGDTITSVTVTFNTTDTFHSVWFLVVGPQNLDTNLNIGGQQTDFSAFEGMPRSETSNSGNNTSTTDPHSMTLTGTFDRNQTLYLYIWYNESGSYRWRQDQSWNFQELVTAYEATLTKAAVTVPTVSNGTLSVTANGDQVANNQQVLVGTTLTVTATPNTDYVFAGWDTDGDSIVDDTTTDASRTVTVTEGGVTIPTPVFTLGTTAVNFPTIEHGSVIVMKGDTEVTSGTYITNKTQLTVTAVPDTDYKFSGWNIESYGTTNPITITVGTNMTFPTPVFEDDKQATYYYNISKDTDTTFQVGDVLFITNNNNVTDEDYMSYKWPSDLSAKVEVISSFPSGSHTCGLGNGNIAGQHYCVKVLARANGFDGCSYGCLVYSNSDNQWKYSCNYGGVKNLTVYLYSCQTGTFGASDVTFVFDDNGDISGALLFAGTDEEVVVPKNMVTITDNVVNYPNGDYTRAATLGIIDAIAVDSESIYEQYLSDSGLSDEAAAAVKEKLAKATTDNDVQTIIDNAKTPVTVNNEEQLKAALADGAMNIVLGDDIELTAPLAVTDLTAINGNGKTISRAEGYTGTLFSVGSGNLILNDVTLDGGAVWTDEEGNAWEDGGNAATRVNKGTVATGFLVHVSGGTVTLGDKTVLQNNDRVNNTQGEADQGSAVYVSAGNLTMDDGVTVKNNAVHGTTATAGDGAAISIEWGTSAVISGTITGNYSGRMGGAVRVFQTSSAAVTIQDATITDNYTGGYGAVLLGQNTNVTMAGTVVIEDNYNTSGDAANLSTNGGTVIKDGGLDADSSISVSSKSGNDSDRDNYVAGSSVMSTENTDLILLTDDPSMVVMTNGTNRVLAAIKDQATLEAAIASGVKNIQLAGDIELTTGSIVIPEGADIILDLNGHNITSTGLAITNNGKLTIINSSETPATVQGGDYCISNSGELNINGDTVSDITISATGSHDTIGNSEGGTIHIDGATIKSNGWYAILDQGKTTGNTIANAHLECGADGSDGAYALGGYSQKGGQWTISEGVTLKNGANSSQLINTGSHNTNTDSPVTVVNGAWIEYVDADNDGTYTVTAKTSTEATVSTLEGLLNAIATAPEGATIKLDGDITLDETLIIDKKITIDLNGYTLTGPASGDAIQVTTEGNLTVTDTSEDKDGEIIGAHNVISNKGNLTVEAGVLTGNGYYAIENFGTATVTGGALYGKVYGVNLPSQGNGILTVEGGSITGGTHGIVDDSSYNVNNPSNKTNTTIINGGTVAGQNGDGVYLWDANVQLDVNGGNISGTSSAINNDRSGTVTIDGGLFQAGTSSDAATVLSGVTLPKGYEMVASTTDTGWYKVTDTLTPAQTAARKEIKNAITAAETAIDALTNLSSTEKANLKNAVTAAANAAIANIDAANTAAEVPALKTAGLTAIEAVVENAKELDSARAAAITAIEKAAADKKAEIDALTNLSDTEKTAAKQKVDEEAAKAATAINAATTGEAVTEAMDDGIAAIQAVAAQAVADDLAASQNAADAAIDEAAAAEKAAIDAMTHLTDDEKAELKEQIDDAVTAAKKAVADATTSEAVEAAEKAAEEALDLVAAKADAMDEINETAENEQAAIDEIAGLTDRQKESLKAAIVEAAADAKDEIDAATTKQEVNTVKNAAATEIELGTDKANAIIAAEKAAADAKAEIDALTGLTDDEKAAYIAAIDKAVEDAVKDIIAAETAQAITTAGTNASAAMADAVDEAVAADFVKAYLTGTNGKIYSAVTAENADQIVSGESTWSVLSDAQKAIVNTTIAEANKSIADAPKSYSDFLSAYEAGVAYIITVGAEQTVTKGNTAAFVSNAPFGKFVKVLVDGKEVTASNYTAVSGSTKVTFTADYITTLSVGEHTLTIVSTDGEAGTTFTVKNAASTNSPATGDDTNIGIWIALTVISAFGIVAVMIPLRRKEKHLY